MSKQIIPSASKDTRGAGGRPARTVRFTPLGARPGHLLRVSASASAICVALAFGPTQVLADASYATCSLSGTVYTCSDIVFEFDLDLSDVDDDYSEILFEDVDFALVGVPDYLFDIDNPGDEGSSHGDDGEDLEALTVIFEGGGDSYSFYNDGTDALVSVETTAGAGHSGKDRTKSSTSGKGGDSGDGGSVTGAQVLEIIDGTLDGATYGAAAAATVISQGGDSYSGGDGRSYGTDDSSGGDGGTGGDASEAMFLIYDDATIEVSSDVDDTAGIYVLSAGGAGGEGGKAKGGTNAHGGDGGDGGDGGEASFAAELGAEVHISTTGDRSHGIEVLSSGGDGGDGGNGEDSLFDAYGGDGGGGGSAGQVSVTVTDDASVDITTTGQDAIGLLARSYGGAGGDGGDADSDLTKGKGGASDEAGPAGDVFVSFQGSITTTGAGDSSDDDGDDFETTSSGILAQSVGGFAGDAGDEDGLLKAYGASSESAGDGGTVTVEINSGTTITTGGTYSDGIEAQSIGGGGGKGGSSDGVVTVGGDGSAGGDGGKVFVIVDGGDDTSITTTGNASAGISAQSIGGGGGKSGGSSGLSATGGTGGTGGDSNVVSVTLNGDVTTGGDYSEGVFAQSIAGGGGKGASNDGLFYQVGGTGGDGGSANTVAFTHEGGDIVTDGIYSDGVDLQSVGGGGGKGASSSDIGVEVSIVVGTTGGDGGDGGEVTYTEEDSDSYVIQTSGSHSDGISAQSGGGGGGKAGSITQVTASVGIGVSLGSTEDGGGGGDGAAVNVDTAANITTDGDHSNAIFAQSYGGGGGKVGNTITTNAGLDNGAVSIATGGAGGDGGNASTVDVTSSGTIITKQDHSDGIFAQSQGGSGGKSSSVYAINSESLDSVAISVGASGGSGGDAAAVTVSNYGDITTSEANSTAIYAQSAGGGGGKSGTTMSYDAISIQGSVSVAVGGDGGDGGSADDVKVTNSGTLTVDEDSSDGIFAQSLAGGGGNSGTTVSGSSFSAASVDVAVGGSAGDGDAAGMVTVENYGDVTVNGTGGYAIYAESRGGSGGRSGTVMSLDSFSGGNVSVSVGGEGGDGGTADAVSVTNSGTLSATDTDLSYGILALSQGGEGGNAGTVGNMTVLGAETVSVAIGGGGGAGGTAGAVDVENSGDITTAGEFGAAISAQSIGGAGGNGSTIYNADLSISFLGEDETGISGDVSVSLGGDGGDGGVAGTVYVNNENTLTTSGTKAYGIVGQSIGGNGGNGGSVYAVNIDIGTTATTNASVSVGGSGAGGATAERVDIYNYGDVETSGLYAHGIVGQSLGGSGGNGGSVSAYTVTLTESFDFGFSLSVGGEGGDGSLGGQVYIENEGDVTVTNKGAIGIYATSLGGDGGDGGSATAMVVDLSTSDGNTVNLTSSVSVGGSGGDGNVADTVTVANSGAVHTQGESGYGIMAQSVGGGGGNGGDSSATSVSFTSVPEDASEIALEVSVEVGGSGGYGGDGGEVSVTNDGSITTELGSAIGIFAQSVGGGGGTGGQSGSATEDYSTWVEEAKTIGFDVLDDVVVSSYSVYSLATDYTSYLKNWTFSIGGSGGAAGDGDTVYVSNTNAITTSGQDADGIRAQSIGGGGGSGGAGTGASISTKYMMGGDGGAGGHADSVTVENSGDITTTGERAHGIWAQSVGGGGGDAGDVEGAFSALSSDLADTNLAINIGASYDGDPGNGGDGGDVSVTSTGAVITTENTDSVGIWAQSVGGGGGSSGSISLEAYFAGSTGDEGDSGDVTVTLDDATVTTTADASIGIFAQSSSGSYNSSGLVSDDDTTYFEYDGDESYDAGDVNITLENGAKIVVSGDASRGILAASTGWDTAGAITISVDDDSEIVAGEGNGHVIELYDGADNVLTNYGLIADDDYTDTSRSDDIYVIRTDISDDGYDSTSATGNAVLTVDNYGVIAGSIQLTEKNSGSTFTNQSDGVFKTGTTIDLGDGTGLLANYGTLSPGGDGQIFTSTVSGGDLEQFSTGTLLVDLDMNGSDGDEEADLLIASSIPTLEGAIEVNVTSSDDVSDGDSGTIFVVVADDLDADAALSASDSAIVDYEVVVETDTDITVGGVTYDSSDGVLLSYTVDVGSSGASVNTSNLSSYLTSASDEDDSDTSSTQASSATASLSLAVTDTDEAGQSTESSVHADMRTVFNDFLNTGTTTQLEQLASAHIIEETGAAMVAARHASQLVHGAMRSCPNLQRSNGAGFLAEQDCNWGGLTGTRARYDNNAGVTGLDEETFGLNIGGQRITDSGWILGVLLRGEDVTLSGDGLRQTGARATIGGVAKFETGPLTYSISAAYGYQSLDQTRSYTVGGTPYVANADVTSSVVSADARVTYLQDFNPAYIRWGLGLGVYHSMQDGFTETGTGTLNWNVAASSQTDLVVRPSIEVGRSFGTAREQGRMFLSLGLAHHLTDPSYTVQGSLSGVGGSLLHQFQADKTMAETVLGVEYQATDNLVLSLSGQGKFSDSVSSGSVSASLRWNF